MFFDAPLEQLSQGDNELAGRFVASPVRDAHERAQVTHRQFVAGFDRRLGPVAPLSGLDARHERFRQGHDALGARLGTPFFASAFTFEMKRCPDGRDPASEKLLGDGLFFVRQALEHGIAVSVARAEALLAVGAVAPRAAVRPLAARARLAAARCP